MNYQEFQKHSFPEKSTFDRTQFDFFTNLTKWLAMRVGFVFYKLGFKANTLDILGIFGSVFGAFLIVTEFSNNYLLALFGLSLLSYGIFTDFLDGPIAQARGEISFLGDALDDLGVDVVKASLITVIAILSETEVLLITNIVTIMVLIVGLPRVSKINFKDHNRKGNKFLIFMLNYLYIHKYSAFGVRVMVPFLLLSLFILITFKVELLSLFSIYISQFYFYLSIIWLFLLMFLKIDSK